MRAGSRTTLGVAVQRMAWCLLCWGCWGCSKSSETPAAAPDAASTPAAAAATTPAPAADAGDGAEAGPSAADMASAAAAASSAGKHARSLAELAHSTTSADWQVARNILEPKVVVGKASRDEVLLLIEICKNQRDRMCEHEANKQLRSAR